MREIPRDQANDIVMANHYSGRVYSGTTIHLGLIVTGELVGVLQFGYAMNPASQQGVVRGTPITGYLELNRMWIDDSCGRNTESRALSYAIKFIRRERPDVEWIQSFADERCGLFGTVYQAAGFDYLGEHMGAFWELDGETYHKSLADRTAGAGRRGAYLRANISRARLLKLRQFRYIRFLKKGARKRLVLTIQPYPKPDYAAGR